MTNTDSGAASGNNNAPGKKRSNWCLNNCNMFGFICLSGITMIAGNIMSLATFWGTGNDWMLDLLDLTRASGVDWSKIDGANEWIYLGGSFSSDDESGFSIDTIKKQVVINYKQTFIAI